MHADRRAASAVGHHITGAAGVAKFGSGSAFAPVSPDSLGSVAVMSMRAHSRRAGLGRWSVRIVFAVVLAWPGLAFAESDVPVFPAGCGALSDEPDIVAAVTDDSTIVLNDGREVRLAVIEVPVADDSQSAAAPHAKAYLASLVVGHKVALARAERDRYGRLVAHAVVVGPQRWIQGEMLARGQAPLAARVGEPGCAAALRRHERAARTAQLGLWADPYYGLRRADDPAAVARERGRFAIVEGNVVSVRESGGTLYVNFGRRWSSDFTATIAKRRERAFAAAGLEPKRLTGRRIRVRGWIEERGGPWIDVTAPEQIEVAERN
jgi:endonuclease YncB( thermonuclease family)